MIRGYYGKNREEVSPIYCKNNYGQGINGNDKPLRPTYLNDPYFNTKEAGYWYKNAKGYAAFKQRVAPLMYSSLINAPVSSKGTPNLIITGEFHDSITAVPAIDKGLRIESVGISFSGDIEKKYGQAIYKVGSYARKAFMERHIKQGIAIILENSVYNGMCV